MTTATTDKETALWASIDAAPADQLRRNVLADFLEERAKMVRCPKCEGTGHYWDGKGMWHGNHEMYRCPTCSGTGYIPDRNGRMAAALRATASRVPFLHMHWSRYSWVLHVSGAGERPRKMQRDMWKRLTGGRVQRDVWERLTGHVPSDHPSWKDYGSALAAIRDLCEAWRKVTYGEVQE